MSQYYATVLINYDQSQNPPVATGGTVTYFATPGGPPVSPLIVRKHDRLKFSLWSSIPGPNGQPAPLPGDLVLIAQYGNPGAAPGNGRSRRSPFNSGPLALYLAQERPNDWNVELQLNGASGETFFEYCVLALLEGDAVVVPIDPSVIIRPNN
jgi:hypothetical protein